MLKAMCSTHLRLVHHGESSHSAYSTLKYAYTSTQRENVAPGIDLLKMQLPLSVSRGTAACARLRVRLTLSLSDTMTAVGTTHHMQVCKDWAGADCGAR